MSEQDRTDRNQIDDMGGMPPMPPVPVPVPVPEPTATLEAPELAPTPEAPVPEPAAMPEAPEPAATPEAPEPAPAPEAAGPEAPEPAPTPEAPETEPEPAARNQSVGIGDGLPALPMQEPPTPGGSAPIPPYQAQDPAPGVQAAASAEPAGGAPIPPYQPPTPGSAPAAPSGPRPSQGSIITALVLGILSIFFCSLAPLGLGMGIAAIVLASRAGKAGIVDGKATAGKACGIIGTSLSAIVILAWIFIGGALFKVVTEDPIDHDEPLYEVPEPGLDETEEQASAWEAIDAELSRIKNKDEVYLDLLSEDIQSYFAPEDGLTLDDMGVDPALYANWLLMDFDYESDGTYVTGDTGNAFVTVYVRDPYEMIDRWNELVNEEPAFAEDGAPISEAEAYQTAGRLLAQAMSETDQTHEVSVALELELVEDGWQVTADSWDHAVWLMLEL